jgi:hypothetical protein
MTRSVGITVLPEFFQNEGVEAVLDNIIHRAGATAIATSPYVMAPVPEGQGSREPPIDAGAGKVRLLDRSLWGRRELWVRTAPSFAPERSLYAGLRYAPATPDALSEAEGGVVTAAIQAARERGLEVHLQVQAAIPPGYRVQFGGPEIEDRPLLPDGSAPAVRVDNNGSIASPHILAYTQALIRNLIGAYPDIDVLRLDWPEYPPYSLDALFFDFSPHAVAAMDRLGFDPERIRRDVDALRGVVLVGEIRFDGYGAVRFLQRHPGVLDWVRVKAAIVTRFIGACAETLREGSGGRIGLMPQAFPPPWTLASGFDYRAVAALGVTGIGVKLYTMHWPMILRAYADPILHLQPELDAGRLAGELSALLDLGDEPRPIAFEDVRYPEPDEPHPAGREAQIRKIRWAQAEAGVTPVHAFAHGYGPLEDVRTRVALAFAAADGRLWVNRYGYLSDAKLDAIGEATSAP